MTLGEMAERVEFNLNRAGLTNVATAVRVALRAETREWAEEALWPPPRAGRRAVGRPHDWSFLRASHSFTTTASDADCALPTDFLRSVRLWLIVNSSPVRLELGNYEYLLEVWAGAADNIPQQYGIDAAAAQLVLFPPPKEAYSGTLRYVQKLTDPAGDEDTNAITERFWAGLVDGGTARVIGEVARAWDEAAQYEARAAGAQARAIAADRVGLEEDDMALWISPNAGARRENPRPLMSDYTAPRRINPLDP